MDEKLQPETHSNARTLHPLWGLGGAAVLTLVQAQPFARYWVANPASFTLHSLGVILSQIVNFSVAGILFMGFLHYGNKILNLTGLFETSTKEESALYAIVFGEAFFAVLILVLGFFHLYQTWIFFLIFGALFYGAVRERKTLFGLIARVTGMLTRPAPWPQTLCLGLIAAALLRGAVASGTPATDWDSLAYHLAFPKIFLQEGGFFRLPWSINSHYPLNTEMIYTLAMGIRNAFTVHWMNWCHGVLFLWAVFAAGKRFFSTYIPGTVLSNGLGVENNEVGWGAVAILSVQSVFQRVLGNASTDFAVALPCMLSLMLLLQMDEAPETGSKKRMALLAGLLCGAASGAKLTGLWASGAFVLWLSLKKERIRCLPYFAGGAFLVASIWYFKNAAWTGNPVWPYLGEWFRASTQDLDTWHRIRDSVTEGGGKSWTDFLLLPARILAVPQNFLYEPQYLVVPFLVFLAARMLMRTPFRTVEKNGLLILLFFSVLWFKLYQNWRYFLPLAGWMSLCLAAWAKEQSSNGQIPKFAIAAALFALIPLKDLSVNNEAFGAFAIKSRSSPDADPYEIYLERTLGPSYALCQIANEGLPKGSKILLYRDVRGFYLDHKYAWGDPLNPGVVEFREIPDAAALHRALRSRGFTHIFFNPTVGSYQGDKAYYERADRLMEECLAEHCRKLTSVGSIGLYEISSI